MSVGKEQLDAMGCGMLNCDHDHSELFLVSRCHMSRGVDVKYVKKTGLLSITCHQCKKLVAEVRVAQ